MIRKTVRRTCIKLALTFVCGAAPLASFAYQASFEGWLISDNASDPPIRIALNLEVDLTGVSGTVKTGSPVPGAGLLGGDEVFGTCDLRSDLGRLTLLRMKGACGPSVSSFTGKYSLSLTNGKRQSGLFRLAKTGTDTEEPGQDVGEIGHQLPELPHLTSTRCIKANSACLLGCPRGDYNAELLCVNRCKQKLNACKGHKGWTPDMPAAPAHE
jgi:hypothetical protein